MTRALALGVAVAAALAVAGAAGSTIVLGKGIAGVTLGMTQAAVRAKLGTPNKVIHSKNELGAYTELRYAGYVVDFQGNAKVTAIVTTKASERTPGGVGVGSRWGKVQSKVPRVHCEGGSAVGICYVGKYTVGQVVTVFFFSNSIVSKVVVGYVLD